MEMLSAEQKEQGGMLSAAELPPAQHDDAIRNKNMVDILDILGRVSPEKDKEQLKQSLLLGQTEQELRTAAQQVHKKYFVEAETEFERAITAGNAAQAANIIQTLSVMQDYDSYLKNQATVTGNALAKEAEKAGVSGDQPVVENIRDIQNRQAISGILNDVLTTRYGEASLSGTIGGLLSNAGQQIVTFGVPYWKDSFTVVQDSVAKHTGLERRFLASDAIADFRRHLATLAPEDRVSLVKAVVKDTIDKATMLGDEASRVQAYAIAAKLGESDMDNSTWEMLDVAFGVLDVQAIKSAGKRLYDVAKTRRAIQGPAQFGEEVAGAFQGGKVGEPPMGMTQAEAVAVANPSSLTQFIEGRLSGASAPVQAKLMEHVNQLASSLYRGLDNGTINQVEAAVVRSEIDGFVPTGNPAVAAHTTSEIVGTHATIIQHPSGAPFASVEAAEAMAQRVGGEVVPATPSATALRSGSDLSGGTRSTTIGDLWVTQEAEMAMQGKSGRLELSAKEVLTTIETTTTNKINKAIAKLLNASGAAKLKIAEIADVKAFMSALKKSDPEGAAKLTTKEAQAAAFAKMGGFYDPSTDTIFVSARHSTNENLLLHEVGHGRAAQVLTLATQYGAEGAKKFGITAKQITAARNLNDLYKQVYTKLRDKSKSAEADWYGLENVHEFLSEGLSNKAFQDVLKNMKLDKGMIGNAWSAFTTSVGKLLGFEMRDDNALAVMFRSTEELLEGQTEAQRTAIARAVKGGKLDEDMAQILIEQSLRSADMVPEVSHGFYVKKMFARYSDDDVNGVMGFALDPLHGASREAIEAALQGVVYGVAKNTDDLIKFITPYTNVMNRKELKLLDNILTEGDSYSKFGGVGKEFNHGELLAKLANEPASTQNKVIDGYFAFRTLNNVMYHIRNAEKVAEANRRGLTQHSFSLPGGGSFSSIGKIKSFDSHVGEFAYDLASGTHTYISPSVALQYSNAGDKLVALARQFTAPNGKTYKHVIGNNTNHNSGLVTSVIPYRPGEYRRIYKDEYFVRMFDEAELDGKMTKVEKTIHTARSARDADEYVSGWNTLLAEWKARPVGVTIQRIEQLLKGADDPRTVLADLQAGVYDKVTKVDKHYTRESDDYVRMFDNVEGGVGGVYNSERGAHITPVDDVNRVNTLPVFQSVQAEIINTAKTMHITKWRDTQIQEWVDTAKHFNALPDEVAKMTDPFQIFAEMAGKTTYVGSDKVKMFLANTHDYIQKQIGVRSTEEAWVEGKLRLLTESVENFLGFSLMKTPVELVGRAIRQGSWNNYIRAYNMHNFFGLNPAQLLVQGWGASTSIAVAPIHGLAAAKEAVVLTAALMSDNPAVWKTLWNTHNVSSLGFANKQDFFDTIQVIRDSGMLRGISGTSMHNVEAGAYNILSPMARKAQAGSLFFFNRGQEFATLTAFGTARREWVEANPGRLWNDPAAIKEIMVRADDLTQNMTKANQARWQQGMLAIPTQFMQYQLKFGQNMAGAYATLGKRIRYGAADNPYRGFTASEATRILGMNIVALGAAGSGLGSFVNEWLGEEMDEAQLSTDTRLAIVEGALAWLINETSQFFGMGDARLALGTRLGVLSWYQQIADSFTEGQADLWKVLLGVSAGSLQRLGVVGNVVDGWRYNPDTNAQDIVEGLIEIAREQPTAARNGWKWYLLQGNEGVLQSKDGKPLAQLSKMEVVAKALGLQSAAEADINRLYKARKSLTEDVKDLTELVSKIQTERIRALKNGDMETVVKKEKMLQAIYASAYNQGMQNEFTKAMGTPNKHTTELNRMIAEYLTGAYDPKKTKGPTVFTTPTKSGE